MWHKGTSCETGERQSYLSPVPIFWENDANRSGSRSSEDHQLAAGQMAAGSVLAGIVWKFFERVEAVLNENTKLEIAIWLFGRKRLTPALFRVA